MCVCVCVCFCNIFAPLFIYFFQISGWFSPLASIFCSEGPCSPLMWREAVIKQEKSGGGKRRRKRQEEEKERQKGKRLRSKLGVKCDQGSRDDITAIKDGDVQWWWWWKWSLNCVTLCSSITVGEGGNPCVYVKSACVRVCVSDGITPMGLLLCQCSAIISLYLPSIRLHLNVSPATITHPSLLSSPQLSSSRLLLRLHKITPIECVCVR